MANLEQNQVETVEAQIAAILEHRYGSGMVSRSRQQPAQLMLMAKTQGFIDAEGYLTRKGRALLARYH